MKNRHDRYAVFISVCLFMITIAGSRPLIPLYARDLGVSHAEIGIIVALFSFLPLFLSIKAGKIIDRIGVRSPLILGILFGSLSMIVLAVFNNLAGIYISQIFSGLAQLIFVLSIQAYAGQFSKSKLREYFISVFSIAVAAGSFVGPLISGGLSDLLSNTYAFFILGFVILLAVPSSFLLRKLQVKKLEPADQGEKEENSFKLLRIQDLRKAVLVSSLVLLAKDAYIAFFPLLAAEKGVSTLAIGVIISLNAAAGILIRSILSWVVRRLKRNVIITISIVVAGIIYILNPFVDSVIGLSILAFVLGFCSGIGQPLSIFSTISSLPQGRVAEGLGLRLMFNKLTQIIAPLSLGAVSSIAGMSGVFYVCGAFIMAGSLNPNRSLFTKNK
ncbi:MFS transporter [Neobacillus drentensis]|uniref:MFS transporter n=1 Tax=Neobacillus drentensis TaxID=220684 RepID=UPI0030025F35